ncbi:uncharacterized protein LOC141770730 isoform X2 [Sebastes fasciatus]|uniref:uncharacterized protein LOC141770730 isoform X2 n=1 Tax=Sebastes fasciatus TaxID=394691 RepID=UPI003D9DECCA
MATPVIRINNPDAPKDRQQAVVIATKEARCYREKKLVFSNPPQELLNQTTALAHAERLLRAEGIPAPSRQQCLGKLVLPFGQYLNAPFYWLVANDVGYMKYMLDKHREEVTNPQRKGQLGNQWVKDHLTEYAESFPQVSALLEANIDRCIYGQRGFEHHTFQEMWELYSQYHTQKDRPEQFSAEQREVMKKAYSSVRRWQNTPVTHILSVQMKRFKKYIKEKEQICSNPKSHHPVSGGSSPKPLSCSRSCLRPPSGRSCPRPLSSSPSCPRPLSSSPSCPRPLSSSPSCPRPLSSSPSCPRPLSSSPSCPRPPSGRSCLRPLSSSPSCPRPPSGRSCLRPLSSSPSCPRPLSSSPSCLRPLSSSPSCPRPLSSSPSCPRPLSSSPSCPRPLSSSPSCPRPLSSSPSCPRPLSSSPSCPRPLSSSPSCPRPPSGRSGLGPLSSSPSSPRQLSGPQRPRPPPRVMIWNNL